ncbi:MAG: alpha/beta hydrolase-fold protein [Acidobacteriota bacterium]|nr:alpha/beta hydrolase-fold protein [Acidobacteriota bacterium]
MKTLSRWYSARVQQEVAVVRYGTYGVPVLLFSTAGGDAEEAERFLMVEALGGLLDAGRIKLFTCDSVAGRAWTSGEMSPRHCSWLQNQFDGFVYHELVPAIHQDCGSRDLGIIAAGASIGAFNAVAATCRHPDVFHKAIAMSGTYDLGRFLHGEWNDDIYYSSPLHFLPGLGEGEHLDMLRRRFILLATGEGRWEDPGESWRMAQVLGAKGVPNRVDAWGTEWDHDWPTWRQMLPIYLDTWS